MKRVIIAALCLIPVAALAQDTASADIPNLGDLAWVAICSNPAVSKPIFAAVGTWIATHLVGFIMKKTGLTQYTPWIGKIVQVLRVINTDAKPPDKVIVAQAAMIMADPVKGPAAVAAVNAEAVPNSPNPLKTIAVANAVADMAKA